MSVRPHKQCMGNTIKIKHHQLGIIKVRLTGERGMFQGRNGSWAECLHQYNADGSPVRVHVPFVAPKTITR